MIEGRDEAGQSLGQSTGHVGHGQGGGGGWGEMDFLGELCWEAAGLAPALSPCQGTLC